MLKILNNIILNETAYFSEKKSEQKVLLDGMRRIMCINKALLFNEPREVEEICLNYPTRCRLFFLNEHLELFLSTSVYFQH